VAINEAFSVSSTTQVLMQCAVHYGFAQDAWISAVKVANLSVA
jgi:hypothetical protein